MILGPSIINAERMSIVRYSEGLYTDDAAILSAASKQRYYKDIFAHFKNLDVTTYLALITSTLSVALVLSLGLRVTYFRAFWMVLKAFCYKPIDKYLSLSMETFVLIIYSILMVMFWIDINKVIGAYMITNQAEDVIDSLEDIIENVDIIPSVNKGSAFTYYFNNQNDTMEREIWRRIVDHNNQAFFRRNSVKDVVCYLEDKCVIEVKTRKLCKKCRLEKCLAAGMRKEFIQNKEQKELRRITIEENKRKKADRRDSNDNKIQESVSSGDSRDSMRFDSQFKCEKVFELNRNVQKDILTLNQCIANQMNHSVMDANQNFLLYLFTPLMRPINTYNDWNEIECKRLSDLYLASNLFRYPSTEHHFEAKDIMHYYKMWGNRLEVDVQDIVKYTKDVTKLVDICEDDKLTLIKQGCMEIIAIRAIYCWDSQSEKWTIFMDNSNSFVIPLDLLRNEKRNLYNTYKSYFRKILPEWNWDSVILDLLTAIVLFNPNRLNLVNRDAIKYQQQMYIHLLQRYLMLRFRWEWQWKSKMSNLMSALIDLQLVSQIEIQNGIEERNSVKDVILKCNFEGKCVIEVKTRKLCKKCRLEKCLAAGMRKEFIQNKEQKELRRITIEENKRKKADRRDSNDNKIQESVSSGDSRDSVRFDPQFKCDKVFELNRNVQKDILTLNQCISSHMNNSVMDANQNFLLYLFTPLMRPINTYNDWNEIECKRLSDLYLASNLFRYPSTEHHFEAKDIMHYYKMWGNRLEVDVQDIVKYTKNVTKLVDICEDDKLTLIKQGCMEIIAIRAIYCWDRQQQLICNTIRFAEEYNDNKIQESVSSGDSRDSVRFDSQFKCDKVFELNRNVQKDILTLNQCITSHMNHSVMDANQNFLLYLFTPLMRPINTYNDWNEIECKRLSDLCLASNLFRYPFTEHHFEAKDITHYYQMWGNRLEVDAQNIVKYTKDMTKLIGVCEDDKLTLIKQGCMEIILLRANYCWDSQAEKWTIFLDNSNSFVIPLDLLRNEKRNLYNTYKSYFRKILPEWNWDSVILDLLTAIVLFNPNRLNLVNKDAVKFQQQMYIHLLQRYLMLRFRWEWQWKSKMSNLMNALIDLQLVSQIEIQNGIEEYQQQMYIHLLQRYLMLRFRWEWQWKSKMSNLMNALIDLQLVSQIEIQNGIEEYIQYFGPIFREILE
ncbi:unnamed protein product [Oppiella nova]|uniref:Nuclear receptor domain-containing protein n=1 Tax=Oppiella nova TaxID=334625 RepID=A0A7R9QGZ7_9ACAR|nr:unnamed protein product [Oppiella nova]CAG2165754.1 unnamed protein product [Oppiella nova]